MIAPFPYFGGKRTVAADVWQRLGEPTQYIEPFCGSAAILLAAPRPAPLEVICDASGFIANFWRACKHQAAAVASWADYPVSHIDLGARHVWLMEQRERVGAYLQDPDWPGDAKVAGWWLWGQCAWIGSGWCDWDRNTAVREKPTGADVEALGRIPDITSARGVNRTTGVAGNGKIPHQGNAGIGVHAIGKIPTTTNGGQGVQAIGKVPAHGDAGVGITAIGQIPALTGGSGFQATGRVLPDGAVEQAMWTSAGRTAWVWLHRLADRLERVRVVHGSWERCLNNHYGGTDTALFLDPPYRAYEKLYGCATPVADEVAAWAAQHPDLRIALCGHRGDYDLPGWDAVDWSRGRLTYGGAATTDEECVWYSPGCVLPTRQLGLFEDVA